MRSPCAGPAARRAGARACGATCGRTTTTRSPRSRRTRRARATSAIRTSRQPPQARAREPPLDHDAAEREQREPEEQLLVGEPLGDRALRLVELLAHGLEPAIERAVIGRA